MELFMEKLSLSVQLVNAVASYLATKPYQEVFQLLQGLQQESKGQLKTGVEQAAEPAQATVQ
jgi:hypothetical protein